MDRQKLKKPEKIFTNIFIGIVLILCSVASFYSVTFKNTGYEKDGKKVMCTVYYYKKFLKNYDVRVEYQNDSGETIQAQLVMRGFPPSYNQTIEGYVIPEEPYKVYQKSNIVLIIIMYVLLFLFFAGGAFIICAVCISVSSYNLLKENGISGTGEIVKIIECTDAKGMKLYDITYVYNDDSGNQQTGKATFERKPPETDKYTVVYARRRNGKYISEMIH